MNQKEKQMVERIMDTEAIGYAYLYPAAGGERKEYLISTTPENLANFVGGHFMDARQMIVTDMLDRLILDTTGGFLNRCPNQNLKIPCPDPDGRSRAGRNPCRRQRHSR